MPKFFISSLKGFSLIDAILAMGISVIVVSICYSTILFQYDQLRSIKGLYTQNLILLQIKAAVNTKNILDAANDPDNSYFKNCLLGVNDTTCTNSDIYPIKIIDQAPVAGLPDRPVGYNLDGQLCSLSGDRNCIFRVASSFRVQCAESNTNPFYIPPTCLTAPGLVEVFYDFSFVSSDTGKSLGLKPVKGSIIVKL